MKITYIILSLFFCSSISQAQGRYLTKQGHVSFFSNTPVEDIKAENNQVLSVLDSGNGKIVISILMKSFMFEKSLMQEHFNENYVESNQFPKTTFKGDIQDFGNLKKGKHHVLIHGDLTIHGVTQKATIESVFVKSENKITLTGQFHIKILNFGIDIPSAVANNIAKDVAISFELNHKPYKK